MSDLPPVIGNADDPNVQAQGSFVIGTTAIFFLTFTDVNGVLYDPSDIDIVILDPDGATEKEIDAADKLQLGYYTIEWEIPSDADPGKYQLQVTYTYETTTDPNVGVYTENFVVLEDGQGVTPFRRVALREYLESLIGYIQRIPVFHETARFNNARTIGSLTFPRWNQTADVKVFLNGELKESGYTVNYNEGKIIFSNALSSYDEVMVNYNFRWFTDEEIDSFIDQGINLINIYPPQTVYTFNTIPDRWIIAGQYAAAIDVIRRWMMDVLFQEPAKIFGGPQRASEIFGQMETLKKNYEGWLEKLVEQKKYGPYVGLTKTVSTPEFTLPGGRSRWFRYLFKGS